MLRGGDDARRRGALRHRPLRHAVPPERRLLPLQLLGGARLRPHRAGRRLRARLPAHRRGAAVRHPAAAGQDPAREHDRALRTP
ncbi:MAG: hypothetical protein MUE62_13660 [Burkholderiaceae bacterium]|nr:hypothetical protein [Burkholderiaceae bacterium]